MTSTLENKLENKQRNYSKENYFSNKLKEQAHTRDDSYNFSMTRVWKTGYHKRLTDNRIDY